jgi:hypothetical protein
MTKEYIYIPQNATDEDKFRILFEALNSIQTELENNLLNKPDFSLIESNFSNKKETELLLDELKDELNKLKINVNNIIKQIEIIKEKTVEHNEKLKIIPNKIIAYKFFWINLILIILFNVIGSNTMEKIISVISNLFNVITKIL